VGALIPCRASRSRDGPVVVHEFDVVPVRVEDEGAVVTGVIARPLPRSSVVENRTRLDDRSAV
jgi:hypothetical protein